jgi:hypothetical protein
VRTLVGRLVFALALVCASYVALCQDDHANSTGQSRRPLPEYIQDFFLSDAVRGQEKGEWQLTAGVDAIGRSAAC